MTSSSRAASGAPVPVRSGPIGAEPVPPAPRTEGTTVSSSGEAAPPAPDPAEAAMAEAVAPADLPADDALNDALSQALQGIPALN